MKRLLCVAAAIGALGFAAARYNISEVQAIVSGGLGDLKFESQANESGLVGAPSEFKVTDATIEYLTKLKKDGGTITVNAQGKVAVK